MSEEFKNLRDLAKDRQPGTPGLYAAEMLRRCKLRDVPVYIDLTQSKEAQIAIGASQEIATWRLPIQGVLIYIAYWIRK